MNRRELIKAISSLAVTLIAPIMFARKAVRRIVPITLYNVDKVSIQDLEDALDDGALEEVYERFRDRWGERSPMNGYLLPFQVMVSDSTLLDSGNYLAKASAIYATETTKFTPLKSSETVLLSWNLAEN